MSLRLPGGHSLPNPSVEQPLGEGGDRLHQWAHDLASFRERHGESGGVTIRPSGTTFTFVTEGVEAAVDQARAAAGCKDVSVAGGAQVIQECLQAGLLDELQIHLVPVLLGGGTRLLDDLDPAVGLRRTEVVDSPGVTHLTYRVER